MSLRNRVNWPHKVRRLTVKHYNSRYIHGGLAAQDQPPTNRETRSMMPTDEMLNRLATILRQRIGPEIGEPYAKTQAFMAAVVLQKLARQVNLLEQHTAANSKDSGLLISDLVQLLAIDSPKQLRVTLDAVQNKDASISIFIEALYASRNELGQDRFEIILNRVRRSLRSRLDRQLECSL